MCVFPGLTKNFAFDETLIKICRADVFWHVHNLIGTQSRRLQKGLFAVLELTNNSNIVKGTKKASANRKNFYGTWALSKIRQYVFMSGSVRFVQHIVVDIYIQFSRYLHPI